MIRRTFRVYAAPLAFLVTTILAAWVVRRSGERDFWFMPGPLGHVRVRTAELPSCFRQHLSVSAGQRVTVSDPPPFRPSSPPTLRPSDPPSLRDSAFLTRVIGLNTPEEQAWGRHNGLTDGIHFIHHLAAVFPRELYKTHPEYFPLVGGRRLDPPIGPIFWQPDLGREDVAAYAADQAKRYFDQHPDAVSFSLGVNDGLNFGESPETVALLRDSFRSRAVERSNRLAESDLPFDRPSDQPSARSPVPPTLWSSEPQPLRSSKPQALRPSDPPSFRPSELPTLRPSVPQSLRSSVSPSLRPSVLPFLSSSGIHYFRGRPDFSPLVFTFMNRAAARLARSYPEKYLGCLAYYWCENTPPFPVDSHVIPFLTADRSQSYDPAFVREEYDLQSRWAEALGIAPSARGSEVRKVRRSGHRRDPLDFRDSDPPIFSPSAQRQQSDFQLSAFNSQLADPRPVSDVQLSTFNFQPAELRPPPRLGLYDYLYGYGFLVPRVPIHAFAEHIRHARDAGFSDYYAEMNANWGLDGPKPWVIAQLLQEPESDVDQLLDLYYRAYFRDAADPMRRFYERCEAQWMHQPGPSYWLKHYRNTSQAALFPSGVCAELRQLLDQAAAQAGSPEVRQRVAFVSDAFGVTERFVAYCEARNELTTRVLRGTLSGDDGERLFAEYGNKRREFVRYTHDLCERRPLAFYAINYDDWLRDDPSFAAREALAANGIPEERRLGGSEQKRADPLNVRTSDLRIDGRELLSNGELAGPTIPGRKIAGLRFGLDLPAPWQSRVEPTQFGVAELLSGSEGQKIGGSVDLKDGRSEALKDGSSAGPALRPSDPQSTRSRVLRLSGQESAIVFTWVPAKPGRTYVASVASRAEVGPSDIVELVVGWLDAKNQRIGKPLGFRLPECSWPDWVRLESGGKAPPGAAWVGLQLVVQHQVGNDWAEFSGLSLRVRP